MDSYISYTVRPYHESVVSPARVVAFEVLKKVAGGGYASDLLLRDSARMDSRDAGLASELVFGCLRRQVQLELGDKFDLGRFHEAVLAYGSVPVRYLPELVRLRLNQPR